MIGHVSFVKAAVFKGNAEKSNIPTLIYIYTYICVQIYPYIICMYMCTYNVCVYIYIYLHQNH